MNKSFVNPPYGKEVGAACGISGFINIVGKLENGKKVKDMLGTMLPRENGLGAGYAVYGCFPDMKEYYCVQLLLDNKETKEKIEDYLKTVVRIEKDEQIPTNTVSAMNPPFPILWRFFVEPKAEDKNEYMLKVIMHINGKIDGAFVMSSGKDMAIFKGNAWSYEIADYYKIEEYKGFMWLSHSRFPTNSPGWWGGAHPFSCLDWSVCHNGEITSYGTNKRYVEMKGYTCAMLTDSEVVTYLWDLLHRKHKLPYRIVATVLSPPYHADISELPEDDRKMIESIRRTYGPAMINGPMSILVGTNSPIPTLIGLTDRKKLRPMIAAESENAVYISSEESAINRVEKDYTAWAPIAGNPVIAQLNKGLINKGTEKLNSRRSE